MKTKHTDKKVTTTKGPLHHADHTSKDADADKTGTDADSDFTEEAKGDDKFDKPKREADPDTTSIDVNSDKTKTEKPLSKEKRSK